MKTRTNSHYLILTGTIAALVGGLPSAKAASATWNGTTGSLWATTTNWSASPVPGALDTATFNNAGNSNTSITVGTISLGTAAFIAGSAAYTLGSGTITFGNGTTTAVTVAATVTNQTINTASSSARRSRATRHSATPAPPACSRSVEISPAARAAPQRARL